MSVRILHGDCRTVMAGQMAENSFDAGVCDPPYELTGARPGGRSEATRGKVMGGFMGMKWDGTGVAFDPETWRQVLRVLKPGAYLLAFGGTRTYHRMVCAIEDAGFEIRDQIGWAYGSGFPKSLDVSKAIDAAAGAEREFVPVGNAVKRMIPGVSMPATPEAAEWDGWGTALKPAWEPIVVARKPLIGTVAANVLAHGTGALNIDACRIAGPPWQAHRATGLGSVKFFSEGEAAIIDKAPHDLGRWPANLIHDGSDEVLAAFPQAPGQIADASSSSSSRKTQNVYGAMTRGSGGGPARVELDKSAARFFYCAKTSKADRGEGNTHPTVKPTDLMRYLCRLVTPPGGLVLDPFMGSGSTLKAAELEGFSAVGIELDTDYIEIARRRIAADAPLFAEVTA